MERHFLDGTEPTVLPHWDRQSPYIPLGCDQQGRHPEVAENAQASAFLAGLAWYCATRCAIACIGLALLAWWLR